MSGRRRPGLPDDGAEAGDDQGTRDDVACLFARARKGDQDAWDTLVGRYSALLWRIARAHHLTAADAADVVQTTWLRLVEHGAQVSDPARLGGWLATTARRECLRVLRLSRRERPHPDDHEAFDGPGAVVPAPDTHLLRQERDAQLWKAVAALPERARLLLEILVADPPPSYDEVAAALGIPRGSIGPTRARTLARLREMLGDE